MGAPALFFCRVPPTHAARGDLPPTGSPRLEPLRPARSPTGERTPAHPQMSVGAVRLHKSRGRKGGGGGEDLCPRPLAGGGRPPFRPLGPPPPVDRAWTGRTPPSPATGRFTPPFRQPQGVKFERTPHTESGDDLLHSAPAQKSGRRRRTGNFAVKHPTRAARSTAGKAAPGKGSRTPVHRAAVPRRSRPSNPRQGRLPRLQTPSSPRGQSAPRAAPTGSGQRPAALYRQMAPVRFAPTPRREL